MKQHIHEIKDIVKEIVISEEKKHDIPLEVFAMTKMEYLMTPEENLESKIVASKFRIDGYTNSITKKAFIIIKDIPIYKYALLNSNEINDFYKNNKQKSIIIALHEIRHILQEKKKEMFSNLDLFAFRDRNIKSYENFIGGYNYLYSEIDANLYAFTELQTLLNDEYCRNNIIDETKSALEFNKNTYDYELLIKAYSAGIKNGGKRLPITIPYWNRKGEYRKISDMIERYNIDPLDPLTIKILTSSDFLLELDTKSLTQEEKEFITYEINLAIKILQKARQDNEDLYINYEIEKEDYDFSNAYFNELIKNKLLCQYLINENEGKRRQKSKI